jgi:MoxR-like ATPase
MQERQVSIGKETFRVPDPFLVMATQNPIESEGTYPLPEAQLDRFAMKVVVGYPGIEEEAAIVHRSLGEPARLRTVLSPEDLRAFRHAVSSVYADRLLVDYAVDLSAATREPSHYGLADLAPYVAFGASPRGPINLVRASQAVAFLRGRDYMLAQDVRVVTKDVLRHRLVLSYEAMAEGVDADAVLDEVLGTVPAPQLELSNERAGA